MIGLGIVVIHRADQIVITNVIIIIKTVTEYSFSVLYRSGEIRSYPYTGKVQFQAISRSIGCLRR